MSSEGENTQEIPKENKESVGDEDKKEEDSQPNKKAKVENDAEKKEDVKVAVVKENAEKKENDTKKDKPEEEPAKPKSEAKSEPVDSKKTAKSEEEEGSDKEEEEEGDDDDDEDKKDDKEVPLLDQPLEQSGSRERKKVQRFSGNKASDSKESKEKELQVKSDIGGGCGVELGEIPRIDASISRFKNDDLKLLHRLIFKTPGKTTIIKKNIKKFNGFDFKKDSDDYTKKIESTKKFELKQLKIICEMLDLDKKGTKDEIVERVVDFLLEPKDSGKPAGGGRPKRTAAVRANNIGYSSHDDSYSSDEQRSSRTTRGKGRRTNLKDDTTSESDFRLSDVSEDKPRVVKRKRVGRKKAAAASDDDDEDDVSDVNESATSEDSDEEPKKRKKVGAKKVVNNSKTKTTPKTRGRKPAAESEKKTPAKRGRKREETSEDSEQDDEENASSSEDEPLIKKAKSPQPPTDDEIKKYVKEILDGANLEEITMKTVCKQVYAHYPDFDLAHKKDFIKSTVKSLIST